MGTECTRPGELCSETWRGTRTQPGRQRASLCRSCRLWVLSEGSTMDYTPRELMVVCAARQIHDGENVFVGMRLPLIAFALAKRTHAPNCIGIFEAGIVRDVPAAELLYTMGDAPNITGALWATNTLNVMGMLAAGDVHLGFIGGAEVDRYGNLNTSMIGDWKHPSAFLHLTLRTVRHCSSPIIQERPLRKYRNRQAGSCGWLLIASRRFHQV